MEQNLTDIQLHQKSIAEDGFTIINGVFNTAEINRIIDEISVANPSKPAFRKSSGLFAIRQFLKEVPKSVAFIFTQELQQLVHDLFGPGYFVAKSLYFDKPEQSNWFVAYHQDLTISVDKRTETAGFGPWTVKQDQFSVHPPLEILQNNFTLRIHLDETNEENGALKVIPGSHLGISRPAEIDWEAEKEVCCNVEKGGIMVMKPLLLHSSGRTTNNKKRRVVHIEFGKDKLPNDLNWAEYLQVN